MERLIEILSEIKDEYDYYIETGLFSERKLDSFDLVELIAEIKERFGVDIPAVKIREENFDSAKRIWKLIEDLMERK